MAGHAVIFGQIEGTIARILESRLDDGDKATGRMRGNVAGAGMDDVTVPVAGQYTDDLRYDLAFRL